MLASLPSPFRHDRSLLQTHKRRLFCVLGNFFIVTHIVMLLGNNDLRSSLGIRSSAQRVCNGRRTAGMSSPFAYDSLSFVLETRSADAAAVAAGLGIHKLCPIVGICLFSYCVFSNTAFDSQCGPNTVVLPHLVCSIAYAHCCIPELHAGIYSWTPVKRVVNACRPMPFFIPIHRKSQSSSPKSMSSCKCSLSASAISTNLRTHAASSPSRGTFAKCTWPRASRC